MRSSAARRRGTHVDNLFMIHTAEWNHVAPFEYLVAFQHHGGEVATPPPRRLDALGLPDHAGLAKP
jgi:hypothetical protein